MARIRPETPADHDAVNRVHRQAFGQLDEADLVEQLRRDAHPHVSLVAEVDGTVVGHIFFSPVELPSPERSVSAMGLAPMAVLPEWQRQGIGAQLVREGLAACRRRAVGGASKRWSSWGTRTTTRASASGPRRSLAFGARTTGRRRPSWHSS